MKRFVTIFVLFFVGSWLLYICYGGQINFYILPRFNIFIVLTGLLLLLSATALLLFGKNWHEVRYHLDSKSLFSFFCLFGAVLIFPPQPLSSQSVTQRGIETDLSNIKLTTPINFQIDSTKRTFADWINIIGTSENLRQYVGENAKLQGFVYRDETLAKNEFYLARFLIRCCSADARPVVLRIKSDRAEKFLNDEWIEIEGVFKADENTEQPLFIDLRSHKTISMPEIPYIY